MTARSSACRSPRSPRSAAARLVKQCKGYAEEARVAVRNARRDANSAIERAVKEDSLPEDDERRGQAEVQKLTDKYIAEVDEAFKKKEAEVMEI